MKHLIRLFLVFALVLAFAPRAHAVNFHVTVLDPPNLCSDNPSGCLLIDATQPFTATFSTSTCSLFGLPANPGTDGCLALVNFTSEDITSLNLTFSGLGGLTFSCDTAAPGSIFSGADCGSSGGIDTFSFYDGVLHSPGLAIIVESGVDPDLFDGTGSVNTPEPASFPLLLTGMLFAGLYVGKRNHLLFATARK